MITGASARIGAAIARHLHRAGMNICLHYRHSEDAARALRDALEAERPDSATVVYGDLHDTASLGAIVEQATERWGRLDVLINNASSFFPTPVGMANEDDWANLIDSNLKGPFFLTQAAVPALRSSRGCIINLIDIHAEKPRESYSIYCIAKAGLAMLTRAMALELSPDIRVNGIAPGAILWSASEARDPALQAQIVARIPLARQGSVEDIATTAQFLIESSPYVTGQILAVDGGRSLNL